MAKRVITKIGDIFSVRLDNGRWRFFQYIANDISELNSSVIRVFKRDYPESYTFNAAEVVDDEVDFYAHTVLKFGIVEGAWQKAGNSNELGDTENIMFREFEDNAVDHSERTWSMWKINKDREFIGKLTEYYRQCSDIGFVIPYTAIVKRINEGVYTGSIFTPEEL